MLIWNDLMNSQHDNLSRGSPRLMTMADISSGAIVGEQARRQDQRRNPSAAEAMPALVQDSADEEPSAEEMRRARLLRFGLAPR